MLRHLAFAALLVAFGAMAVVGLRGWSRTTTDETPLQVAFLPPEQMAHIAMMGGYPWSNEDRVEVSRLKDVRFMPPDTGDPTCEDMEKENTKILLDLKVTMPTGRLTWPEIVTELRRQFEPAGVEVIEGPARMQPPEDFTIDIPAQEFKGLSILYELRMRSQKLVGYVVTSEGVAVGTDAACNRAAVEAMAIAARRRVAPEHDDPRLDAEFRPDVVDSPLASFAAVVKSQTDVPMVVDSEFWDTGMMVKWRGEPRRLRDALDELAKMIHAFWRFHGGRVWLLKPPPKP